MRLWNNGKVMLRVQKEWKDGKEGDMMKVRLENVDDKGKMKNR